MRSAGQHHSCERQSVSQSVDVRRRRVVVGGSRRVVLVFAFDFALGVVADVHAADDVLASSSVVLLRGRTEGGPEEVALLLGSDVLSQRAAQGGVVDGRGGGGEEEEVPGVVELFGGTALELVAEVGAGGGDDEEVVAESLEVLVEDADDLFVVAVVALHERRLDRIDLVRLNDGVQVDAALLVLLLRQVRRHGRVLDEKKRERAEVSLPRGLGRLRLRRMRGLRRGRICFLLADGERVRLEIFAVVVVVVFQVFQGQSRREERVGRHSRRLHVDTAGVVDGSRRDVDADLEEVVVGGERDRETVLVAHFVQGLEADLVGLGQVGVVDFSVGDRNHVGADGDAGLGAAVLDDVGGAIGQEGDLQNGVGHALVSGIIEHEGLVVAGEGVDGVRKLEGGFAKFRRFDGVER
mmetsp:Transcript_22179/g.68279  ORF Transcript_22179/g.68279 Transcript_22179/m.68279 type:complete len:409 (+) Transcript_22179:332-1558(+)